MDIEEGKLKVPEGIEEILLEAKLIQMDAAFGYLNWLGGIDVIWFELKSTFKFL